MLMEGYDRLLQTQTREGKKWFDFADLVGMSRIDLESTYRNEIGFTNPTLNSSLSFGLEPPPPIQNTIGSGNPFDVLIMNNNSNDLPQLPLLTTAPRTNIGKQKNKEGQQQQQQKTEKQPLPTSIMKSLLECANDIVVEGYFTETISLDDASSVNNHEQQMSKMTNTSSSRNSSNVQATIFSSQRQRQFIVCFRGSLEQHEKPVKGSAKLKEANGEPSYLHPTHQVPVNPFYRNAYFASSHETKVFTLLDELTNNNPFFDVVFTGHSFGGALSIIGATRYAAMYPMMTVCCYVFGTPKVGGLDFRHFANSLPNLKVFRCEYGHDMIVNQPSSVGWEHVGHTIAMNNVLLSDSSSRNLFGSSSLSSSSSSSSSSSNTLQQRPNRRKSEGMIASVNNNKSQHYRTEGSTSSLSSPTSIRGILMSQPPTAATVHAYRFGKCNSNGSCSSNNTTSISGSSNNNSSSSSSSRLVKKTSLPKNVNNVLLDVRAKKSRAVDHEMKSYVCALEQFMEGRRLPWVTNFVGEMGNGIVCGVDKEERHVV